MKSATVNTPSPEAILEHVLSRLTGVVKTPNGFKAHCPSHDDHRPSVEIKQGYRCILIKDWAGCSLESILQAIGLRTEDLFYDPPRSSRKSEPLQEKANLRWRWDWRRQVNEITTLTELQAGLSQDFLDQVKNLDAENLSDDQRDFLLERIALAFSWLRLSETSADLCFDIAHRQRQEEGLPHG